MDFTAVFRWLVVASLAGLICFCCGCLKPELGGWCIRMVAKLLRSTTCCMLCCAAAGRLTFALWHAPLDQFIFDSVSADADGTVEAALLRGRPLLLLRNRIFEATGFAAESLDFVAALEDHFYIAVQDDGQYDQEISHSRPVELRIRLDELMDRSRLEMVTSRPHIQIQVGPAGDFTCPEPETTFCIGRTAFETDRVPRTWMSQINSQHHIWVPSPFNVETFSRAGVQANKLRFIPEPLDTDLFRPRSSDVTSLFHATKRQQERKNALERWFDPDCDFIFLSVFAWSDRKGWDVLLRGFFSEFQPRERVCLLLRTYPQNTENQGDNPEIVRGVIGQFVERTFGKTLEKLSRVIIVGSRFEVKRMPELYAAADAFVLPTRGEGWGRTIAEAMAMGLPTIATNWSGHTLFANETTSWPVSVAGLSCIDNVQHAGQYARHRWAEPSTSGLRKSMRRVYDGVRERHPEVLARTKAGRAVIAGSYSLAAVSCLVQQDLAIESLSLPRGRNADEAVDAADTEPLAALRAAAGETNLDPDESLLRNLFDAATGRLPSLFERLWAHHVGWRTRWKQFFCVLCFEARGRNEARWETNVANGDRAALGQGAAGYGWATGDMCRVCKSNGRPIGIDSSKLPVDALQMTETEDPRRLQQQHKQYGRDGNGVQENETRKEEEASLSPPRNTDETFWGGTVQTERAAFEAEWGRCHTPDGRGVLIALPYSDFMPCTLREKMFSLLKNMECANPGWNLYLALYDKPYHNDMDARKTRVSGRGVLAHIRNIVIEEYLQPSVHEYVLWVDADVVDYPPNLITLLHTANPGGVTAPTVLIEGSNSEAYHSRCRRGICGGRAQTERHYQFYDRAAFIVAGTNITSNPSFPGNAMAFPPYLGGTQLWDEAKHRSPSVIDCAPFTVFIHLSLCSPAVLSNVAYGI